MGTLSVTTKIGRLTRDAELKYTSGGAAVCKFCVATDSRKKKGDDWVNEASFWDVELWGKQAESLNQYLTKGKLVSVTGDERQDRWEQDGQQRMKVVVNANSVVLLSQAPGGAQTGSDGRNHEEPRENASQARRQRNPATPAPAQDDFSDDIPF